jgi:hypothetical protein
MPRHTPYLALLLLASCWSAKDNALFKASASEQGVSGASTSAAGSLAASSGTGSGIGAMASGGTGANGTGASGGTGAASGSGGTDPAGEGGKTSETVQAPVITDCSMVEGSIIGDGGHCYRVNEAELTYAEASQACAAAGGHLVTIGSEVENELAEQLHDGEHWLGASDGLGDKTPGVGTYTWVDGSSWEYTYWEDNQPNAFETDCPDEDDEADCFEHCAFQTDEGDWNDRSCWHTIASICEWDVAGEPPVEGAGGAGGAGGAEP